MNLLQSFMGCMYPDIVRTESIESMDHECRFQAANIDEKGNEISRGELQITNDELVYYKPSKSPFRWPLNSIRRWGYIDEGHKFVFETGRKSPTGAAIYAFRLGRGHELVEQLNEKTRREPQQQRQHATNGQSGTDTSRDRDSSSPPTPTTQGQRRKDVASGLQTEPPVSSSTADDPRPLSYSLIDFPTTKALNESAQAHAASRDR